MATLYVPNHSKSKEVTLRIDVDKCLDRKEWVDRIHTWAKEHNVRIRWRSDSTFSKGGNKIEWWHESTWYIYEDADRMMFILRWK